MIPWIRALPWGLISFRVFHVFRGRLPDSIPRVRRAVRCSDAGAKLRRALCPGPRSSGLRSRRGFGWFQGRGRATLGLLDEVHQANVDVLTPSCLVAVDREHIAARLEAAAGIPPEGN